MTTFQDDTAKPKSSKVLARVQPEKIARFVQGYTQVLARFSGWNAKVLLRVSDATIARRANSLTPCRTLPDNHPAVTHLTAGHSTPDNQGPQRPQSNVVFLCPSKTRAALCCAFFIMVVRGGQPKGWPVPWPVLRTHHAPPPDYSQQFGGGNPSYQGVTA